MFLLKVSMFFYVFVFGFLGLSFLCFLESLGFLVFSYRFPCPYSMGFYEVDFAGDF